MIPNRSFPARYSRNVVLLAAALVLPSCAWLNSDPKAEKKEEALQAANAPQAAEAEKKPKPLALIGRIHSYNKEQQFVIVQAYAKMPPLQNVVMISQAKDQSRVNLNPTGESQGQFFAADVRNGVPNLGDAVFFRNLAEEQTTTPTPSTANPQSITKPQPPAAVAAPAPQARPAVAAPQPPVAPVAPDTVLPPAR